LDQELGHVQAILRMLKVHVVGKFDQMKISSISVNKHLLDANKINNEIGYVLST
jgi:hypothetical protein